MNNRLNELLNTLEAKKADGSFESDGTSQSVTQVIQKFLAEADDLFRAGQEVVQWLKGRYCNCNKDDLCHATRDPDCSNHRKFRAFLVSLQQSDRHVRNGIIADYLNGRTDDVDYCIKNYLIPRLSEFFRHSMEEHKYYCSEKMRYDVGWEAALADFVDRGLFVKCIEQFKEDEGVENLDEEFCAKIFYRVFKQYFDTRPGLGYMEMINVGVSHPEILEKMRLMEEYEDIRVALLRLQLIGEIRSVNYR